MKRPRVLLLFVVIGALFIIPATALRAAPAKTTAYTKDRIMLRAAPDPTARVIIEFPAYARVRVNHCAAGWCSITMGGRTGYALENLLIIKSRPPAKKKNPRPAPAP
jgi:uncharacterized protein YgiM (DUF1202 family)